jgi:hypothetical protein
MEWRISFIQTIQHREPFGREQISLLLAEAGRRVYRPCCTVPEQQKIRTAKSK